jgi:hypothetical protein
MEDKAVAHLVKILTANTGSDAKVDETSLPLTPYF